VQSKLFFFAKSILQKPKRVVKIFDFDKILTMSKRSRQAEQDVFEASINSVMSNTRQLVQKKLKHEPFSAEELYDHFLATYETYAIYRDVEKSNKKFNKRILSEYEQIMIAARDWVWKNAAQVCLCLQSYGLFLPAEIWHVIVQAALHDKQEEMHQFAHRVFHGTTVYAGNVIVPRDRVLPAQSAQKRAKR